MARIAIIGLGSIGSRHIDNLLAMGYDQLMGYDINYMQNDQETRLPIADRFRHILEWGPTHALICTPPDHHYLYALDLLDIDCRVFIEKPMTLCEYLARDLVVKAAAKNLTLAVGYMCRAVPKIQQLKASLGIGPHSCRMVCRWKWARKTYSWPGILWENSHEVDLAMWLFGPTKSIYRNIGDFYADLILEHSSGSRTTMHLCADAENYERMIEVRNGVSSAMISLQPEDFHEAYKIEVEAFLKGEPLCSGYEGLHVVKTIGGL